MKKIIFVEKDNGRVDDPVCAYFVGRKNASVAKSGVK